MNNEKFRQAVLSELLLNVTQGISWLRIIRSGLKNYLLILLTAVGLTLLAYYQWNLWAASTVIAFFSGYLLRDIDWIRGLKKTWPITREVIDRKKLIAPDSSI